MLGLARGGLAVAVEDVLEGELALGGVGRGGGRRGVARGGVGGNEVGAVGGGDVRGAVEIALLAAEAGGETPDFGERRRGGGGGEVGCCRGFGGLGGGEGDLGEGDGVHVGVVAARVALLGWEQCAFCGSRSGRETGVDGAAALVFAGGETVGGLYFGEVRHAERGVEGSSPVDCWMCRQAYGGLASSQAVPFHLFVLADGLHHV